MWPEIEQAKSENKRELKLIGAEIAERIHSTGIDNELFSLSNLNLLNISDTNLQHLPDEISNLKNLQSLLLFGNEISTISDSIAGLEKLKVLDVSRNKLNGIPDGIGELKNLATLNLSHNAITQFPALKSSEKLLSIDLSNNKLAVFPDICYESNVHLSEVNLQNNAIDKIPHGIVVLASLKQLNLAQNNVTKIPKCLADMPKLKGLELNNNPVADKRLLKLIQQCRSKQILDYVKQHGEDRSEEQIATTDNSQIKPKGNKEVTKTTTEAAGFKMIVERHSESTIKVIYDEQVREIRPYILCCIVKNVDLSDGKFRKFLQLQSKLHDNMSICGKREKSTIATHDLVKIQGEEKVVKYTVKDPNRLKIHPLGKPKTISAVKFYNDLKAEAEALRKEHKRNVFSGIHKYLYLLENKSHFPCVEDSVGNIISLPPLTNSDLTKISPDSTDLFLEVTSSSSISDCRVTIEELLKQMLLAGIGQGNEPQQLIVQQIKITDADGNLKTVYPSKTDLNFTKNADIHVERQ